MSFAENLKLIRKERNLSQEDMNPTRMIMILVGLFFVKVTRRVDI